MLAERMSPESVASRPRVLLNMIASADGRATLEKRTAGLSSAADRARLARLREEADAVLVGAGTVRAERYGRMLRDGGARARRVAAGLAEEPLACVVSASLSLDPQLPLLAQRDARVVILTAAAGELPPCAADVRYLRRSRDGRLDLAAALVALRDEYGVRTLVCEGGPTLNGELVAHGLLDELLLTVAPALVGGRDPLTIIAGADALAPVSLELLSATPVQSHVFLHYRVRVRASDAPATGAPPDTAR